MDRFALAVEVLTALITVAGIVYGVIALLAARSFARRKTIVAEGAVVAPMSILKPLKGVEPSLYAGFVTHCLQDYAGEWEILFGVRSLADPAVALVARLRVEHPHINIRLVECPQELGANGKVSTLAQMLPHASYDILVVNDSDIAVPPNYLSELMRCFAEGNVGMVTALYRGRAAGGLWSRMEALGIATDFMPGVLTARRLEGGIHFGLGSTLAMTREALTAIGGFAALADQLADDYELGARISAAGYRVELAAAIVETSVPGYKLRSFCVHQLRWARSTRDSRRAGYAGLGVTYTLPWALLAVLASGGALWSFTLLSLTLLVRVALALVVGVSVLRDGQVLRDIVLLPLRDCFGLFFWAWSYASDVVMWRGEKFTLRRGVMTHTASSKD